MRRIRVSLLSAAAAASFCAPAQAKPAQCFTTDDGHFPCDFTSTAPDGSFEIAGEGIGYALVVDRPGTAFGFVTLDGRNIPLPGRYVRSREDGACWDNAETQTRICAW